jgi:hypothetical protein
MSSQGTEVTGYVSSQNKYQMTGKDLKNFYNFDERAPMKFRMNLFIQQFKELSSLKKDQVVKLIQVYDKNLNKAHDLNSSQFAIIGSLFLYVGWLMLNASSVFIIQHKSIEETLYGLKTNAITAP